MRKKKELKFSFNDKKTNEMNKEFFNSELL